MRKKIIIIYSIILAVGLSYYLIVTITGKGLPCAVYSTTGLLCPGCGISRMFMSMFRLDFVSAFRYNPVAFSLFFYWNMVAFLCFWGRFKLFRNPKFLYTSLYVSVGILFLFGIARNFS